MTYYVTLHGGRSHGERHRALPSPTILRPVAFRNAGVFAERYELIGVAYQSKANCELSAEYRGLRRVGGIQLQFDPARLR